MCDSRSLAEPIEQRPQPPGRAAFPLAIGKVREEIFKEGSGRCQGRICAVLIFQALHAAPDLFGFFWSDGRFGHSSNGGRWCFIRPALATEPVHEIGDKAAMFPVPARGGPESLQGCQQMIQGRKRAAPPELMSHGAGGLFGILARIGSKELLKQAVGRLERRNLGTSLFPGRRIPPPIGLWAWDGRCAWERLASGGC